MASTDTRAKELIIMVENEFDPIHISLCTNDHFEPETWVEIFGGILVDLHSTEILSPELKVILAQASAISCSESLV